MESMKAGAAAVPAVTTVVAVPAVIAAPMPQTISPPTTPPPTAPAATAQPLTLPGLLFGNVCTCTPTNHSPNDSINNNTR